MILIIFNADINKGDVKDTEMEAIMDSLVDGLFSVCVTHGEQLKPPKRIKC